MSSSSSDTPGVLVTRVPHWAAVVNIFDNRYAPVATLTPSAGDTAGPGPYRVEVSLPPGVYGVRVTLGASSVDEWVSIRSGKTTTVEPDRWAALQLPSAAPLTSATVKPSDSVLSYAKEAQHFSRTITWKAPETGSSRLFIFVHTLDAERYPRFAQGLSLLDAEGRTLTPITGSAIASDTNAPAKWIAFTTDLPSGFYILERSGPEGLLYKQPLYLCDGWETQVFMLGGRGPSFRSLTLNMAPKGQGFRFDDPTAAASEAVLAGLRDEVSLSTVLASSHVRRALRGDIKNPWLAVLVTYAVIRREAYFRRGLNDQRATPDDSALKDEAIEFLRNTIPDHPDVRAIRLAPNAPSPEPFDFPPLMRIGLHLVQRHATAFTSTIPAGSLTARVLRRQVTSSPWAVWRESVGGLQNTLLEADDLRQVLSDLPAFQIARDIGLSDADPQKGLFSESDTPPAAAAPKFARTPTFEEFVSAIRGAAAQLVDLKPARADQKEASDAPVSADLQASAAALAQRFLAILRAVVDDETRASLPDDVLKRLTTALSSLTLHASFIQYGSAKRRVASLEALGSLATGLEKDLSSIK